MSTNFFKPEVRWQGKSAFRNPLAEIILLVVVGVLLFWFIVLPKKAQTQAQKLELDRIKLLSTQTSAKLAKLRELADSLKAHQTEVTLLDKALPLDGKSLRLQLLLEALAKSAGVTVGDININGKGNAVVSGDKDLLKDIYGAQRNPQKLSGSVYVIGNFSQLKAFLQKIESSGRLIDITDLSLDAGQDGNLNMKVAINSYYFAP